MKNIFFTVGNTTLLLFLSIALTVTIVSSVHGGVYLQKLHVEVVDEDPATFDRSAVQVHAAVDAHIWGNSQPTSTTLFHSSTSSVFSASRSVSSSGTAPSSDGGAPTLQPYIQPGAITTPTIGPVPQYATTSFEEPWMLLPSRLEDGSTNVGDESIHLRLSDDDVHPATTTAGPQVMFLDTSSSSSSSSSILNPVSHPTSTYYNAFVASFRRTDANLSVDPICTSTPLFKCCPSSETSYTAYFLAFNSTPISCIETSTSSSAPRVAVVADLAFDVGIDIIGTSTSSASSEQLSATTPVRASIVSTPSSSSSSSTRVYPSSSVSAKQHSNSSKNIEVNISIMADSFSSTASRELESIASTLLFTPDGNNSSFLCFNSDTNSQAFVAVGSIFGSGRNKLGYFADVFAQQDLQCGGNAGGAEYTAIILDASSSSNNNNNSVPSQQDTVRRDPFDQLADVRYRWSLSRLLSSSSGGCDLASTTPSAVHLHGSIDRVHLACSAVRNVQLQVESTIVHKQGNGNDFGNDATAGSSSLLRRLFPLSVIVDSFYYWSRKKLPDGTQQQQNATNVVLAVVTFCMDVANRGDVPSPPGSILVTLPSIALLTTDGTSSSSSSKTTKMMTVDVTTDAARPGIALFAVQRFCIETNLIEKSGEEDSAAAFLSEEVRGVATLVMDDVLFAKVRGEVELNWRVPSLPRQHKTESQFAQNRSCNQTCQFFNITTKVVVDSPFGSLLSSSSTDLPALSQEEEDRIANLRSLVDELLHVSLLLDQANSSSSPPSPSSTSADDTRVFFPVVLITNHQSSAFRTAPPPRTAGDGGTAVVTDVDEFFAREAAPRNVASPPPAANGGDDAEASSRYYAVSVTFILLCCILFCFMCFSFALLLEPVQEYFGLVVVSVPAAAVGENKSEVGSSKKTAFPSPDCDDRRGTKRKAVLSSPNNDINVSSVPRGIRCSSRDSRRQQRCSFSPSSSSRQLHMRSHSVSRREEVNNSNHNYDSSAQRHHHHHHHKKRQQVDSSVDVAIAPRRSVSSAAASSYRLPSISASSVLNYHRAPREKNNQQRRKSKKHSNSNMKEHSTSRSSRCGLSEDGCNSCGTSIAAWSDLSPEIRIHHARLMQAQTQEHEGEELFFSHSNHHHHHHHHSQPRRSSLPSSMTSSMMKFTSSSTWGNSVVYDDDDGEEEDDNEVSVG